MDALNLVFDTITQIGISFIKNIPLFIMGILVVVLFNYLAGLLQNLVKDLSIRSGVDFTLGSILASLAGIIVRVLGVLLAAVVIIPSFEPGSLIAGLGLSSVAIGFAFKDILQNFVAGILILWNKPFTVGDVIETSGHSGTVTMINVRSTYIKTFDGKQVIVPNGAVFDNDVKVYSAYANRRIEIPVGIGYGDSIDEGRDAILNAVRSVDGVLDDPEPAAYLAGMGASSLDFEVFVWVNQKESSFLQVKHDCIKAIKEALDEKGIDIPYPYQVLQFENSLQLQARSRKSQDEEKELVARN